MPTKNENPSDVTEALTRLSRAMERMEHRYHASQRNNRRARIALAVVLAMLGVAAYQALAPMGHLLDLIPKSRRLPMDAQAAAEKKQRLLEVLPEDSRAELKAFEEQQEWLSGYLAASPDFNAGAAVALFLAQMAQSVQVMPKMYAEVHAMNEQMRSMNDSMRSIDGRMQSMDREIRSMSANINALPALTAEIQGMHVKMGIMAAGMDSTMGRAGRMFPWP